MSLERPTRVRFVVLGALCAAAAIVYVQRQSLGMSESTLRAALGFSKAEMGLVLSIWLWTYALLQIPGGWLGDRWGSQRALPLYCAVWSIATMLTGYVTWLPALLAIRLVFGAAHAGLFPCTAIILKQWFPEARRGVATAWVAAFQQVGAAVGSVVAGTWLSLSLNVNRPDWAVAEKMVTSEPPAWIESLSPTAREAIGWALDWRALFFWISLPGLVWSFWFWRWFRDHPDEHHAVNETERRLLPGGGEPRPMGGIDGPLEGIPESASIWRAMLSSSTMWLICGQQFCRAAGYFFFQSWFPTFLQHARGVTIEKSGIFTSIMFVAALFGALSGGWISDAVLERTGNRRLAKQGVAILGLLGAAVLAVLAYFVSSPDLAVAVLAAGSFLASAAGPSAYSVTIDIGGRHTATVFGTMNMAGNFGAALLPLAVPVILAWAEQQSLVERIGVSGWDLVLFLFAGIYFAGAACWMFLNPNRTLGDDTERTEPV